MKLLCLQLVVLLLLLLLLSLSLLHMRDMEAPLMQHVGISADSNAQLYGRRTHIAAGQEIRVDYDMGVAEKPFRQQMIRRGVAASELDGPGYKTVRWAYPGGGQRCAGCWGTQAGRRGGGGESGGAQAKRARGSDGGAGKGGGQQARAEEGGRARGG